MMSRRRRFWGFGYEDAGPGPAETDQLRALVTAYFEGAPLSEVAVPRVADLSLRAPRVQPSSAVAALCTSDPFERASHTYGKAFRDVVRALARDFAHAPDLVAYPRDEHDL